MPTVIESFVTEFTLDPTDFEKGSNTVRLNLKRVREDAATSGEDMETFGKRGASMIGKLRNEAIGLFLAFQGASSVTSFVSNMLTADAATARFAGNIGMTTNELSAWQLVVQGIGGQAEDANAALGAMANAYQSFLLTGTTGHDADFRGLGVRLEDLQNPADALLKIAEAGERMGKPEFYARLQRIGLPQSVINQLEQGRAATEALVEAKKRDGAATDADAAAAERFQRKLNDFRNHLTQAVRPAIYGVVDALDDLLIGVDEGNVKLPDMDGALVAIGVTAAAIGSPLIAVAAVILLIANNIDYLREKWQAFQDSLDDLGEKTDWFFDPLREAVGLPSGAEMRSQRIADAAKANGGQVGASAGGGAGFGAGMGGNRAGDGKTVNAGIEGYLRQRGFSAAQARGIAAGITAEGGTPTAVNPTSGAFGIGQWLGGRKRELFRRYGKKPTMQNQLDFLIWELRGGDHAGGSVTAQTSAEGTMVAYLRDFMRPGAGLPGDLRRGYRALGLKPNTYRGSPAGAQPQRVDNSTHIGTITVYSTKADPKAVAEEIPAAVARRKTTTQANRGLQ